MHASPSFVCTCGLHGTHGVDILRRTRCPAVLGRVALWGHVIEHDVRLSRRSSPIRSWSRSICQFCFWQWGTHGAAPDVVGWFPRDELVPLCWTHLEQAERYGMEPRRLLTADEIDEGLRQTYAVDRLVNV